MPTHEEIEEQKELLRAHRQTLSVFLKQQATQGSAFVPPGIVTGINESRTYIRFIKTILRDWGVQIDNHPNDEPLEINLHSARTSPTIEGILRATQGTHQEKKLRYYNNLLASITFQPDIDPGTTNALIHIAEQLSYRQLCILSLCIRRTEFLSQESSSYIYAGRESAQLLSLHSDVIALSKNNLIWLGNVSSDYPVSGEIQPGPLGTLVFDLMKLSELDKDDIQHINIAFQDWNPTMVKVKKE